MPLDATDLKILNMLITNGRTSYTDISKEVGMKPPSVIDRIKKMETDGLITGYTANVDYRKLGYDVVAFVGVTIDNPSHIDEFEANLDDLAPDIVECYHITGEHTLLLKVITLNTNSLAAIVKKLRALPGVSNSNTMLVFSTMKDGVLTV